MVADFFVRIPVQQSGILCTHDLDVCPAAMSGLGRTGGLLPFGAAVQKECLYSFVRVGVALAQAVAPLNTLRNARGVGDYEVTGKSQEDVINEILMERRRELWGEGFGITDILRTQKAVERAALSDEMQKTEVDCWQEGGSFEKRNPLGHWFLNFPNGKPFTVNSTYYLYAIPQKEINANPNI